MAVCAVGQGPLEREVTALRNELGLQGVVTLTGYRPDAVRLMAGCDIFVLGSKCEGLPVALMEASALGLPIVATRVGGIPDAFHDGVDAVLVAPGIARRARRRARRARRATPSCGRVSARRRGPRRRFRRDARGAADRGGLRRGRERMTDTLETRPAEAADLPADPRAPAGVDGTRRRRTLRRAVPLEASRQRVRAVADVGRAATAIGWRRSARSCGGSSGAATTCSGAYARSTRPRIPTIRVGDSSPG